MNLNELLLQPNIAYLFLVGGFLLAMMVLMSPGKGVLEIGALIVLLLAGWEVYNLPINWWAFIVLIVGVFPFMLAVRRSGNLWYLVLSILALIIGSAFLFKGTEDGLQPAVNPFLAIVVSILTAGFMWLITVKTLEAQTSTPTHDLSSLIGAIGTAKTDIHLEGTVFINMEDWSAQSENLIPAGSEVRVMDRQGFILNVEPVNQEN
jgi:membrane-bound serine protease (ClpP class)